MNWFWHYRIVAGFSIFNLSFAVFLHTHNILTIIAQYHSRSWLLGFGTGHVLSGCLKRQPDAGLDALAPGLLQMKSPCQGWPFATMPFEILCYHATLQHSAQVEVAPGVKARRWPGRLLKQGIAARLQILSFTVSQSPCRSRRFVWKRCRRCDHPVRCDNGFDHELVGRCCLHDQRYPKHPLLLHDINIFKNESKKDRHSSWRWNYNRHARKSNSYFSSQALAECCKRNHT